MLIPRDYQQEAVDAIFRYFYRGNRGNPLVQAPTGSGKSIMISLLCKTVKEKWPEQKILIISHVKEILEQDYKTLKKHLKNTSIGLYSAGLRSKKIKDITIAGIQSIYNKPELFDQFNIIIVDEAHLIPHSKSGRYHKFFKQVKKPVIGFTATPFRLGSGYLHLGPGSFFDDIVYNVPFKLLQDRGYLCKITCKGTKRKMDVEGIKKQGGDYILKELSLAFDRYTITSNIIDELLVYKDLRKKWLLFAIDIEHAEHIKEQLQYRGIKAETVHSKMSRKRDEVIEEFRNGEYQALVSVAVLTTGFDVPEVDLIGLLRPTSSPVLHVQIIGRGARVAEGKEDCLILDFAGNLLRNGPIDAPVIKLKGDGTGEPIMKECSNCYEIVHAAVRVCPTCNTKFQFRHHLSLRASDAPLLNLEEWHPVADVEYNYYVGSKGIPMLQVIYICGVRRFKEYVCIEHGGYAARKAQRWWERRSSIPAPVNAYDAVEDSDSLIRPIKILVEESGKFPQIKDHKFEEA